jgi:hypothetical protein
LAKWPSFAPGDDVVAECREVAVGDDRDSEGGVLAAVLGDAAGGRVTVQTGDGAVVSPNYSWPS